jgi:single-strand DNA-binding protein
MNNLRNKVQLIGNVGQTPEIISFDNGNKLAKITVATNERFKNAKGEQQINTTWHNLIAWGKTADVIENYLKKGQEIAIEGKLIHETYDAKDGSKRYATKIQINDLVMLSSSK